MAGTTRSDAGFPSEIAARSPGTGGALHGSMLILAALVVLGTLGIFGATCMLGRPARA